jgi:hypothetical protein
MSDFKETPTPARLRRIVPDPKGDRLAAKIARCTPDHDPGELIAKFRTDVLNVSERSKNEWFVHLRGSHESLYVGHAQPALVAGDMVEVSLRKLP